MQTLTPSKGSKQAEAPNRRMAEENFFSTEISSQRAGEPKTMENYCGACRRNTRWEEVRSWNASCGIASLHPAAIRVGWKCRTCGDQKRL